MIVRASSVRVAETELRAQRRRFSAADKLRILEEADAGTEPGAMGALLRREGLYASHLTTWRAENARLAAELAQAREVMDVQGKVSTLLRQLADQSTLPPSAT